MRIPIHPGEILADELAALGLNATRLAVALKVPAGRVARILRGRRAVTVDTARRLARFFGTTTQYWLNLQMLYDIDMESGQADKKAEIESIIPWSRNSNAPADNR